LSQAAGEYERIASQSDDAALRSEALLDAGDLYAQSNSRDRALDAYNRYVKEFPKPVETAIETRFKIAEMYKAAHDETLYHKQLEEIVSADAAAGSERTGRTRTVAARSALVLAEQLYENFVVVKLRQPFETSLQDKKQRMDATIAAMGRLVEYGIDEVTPAATFYMAETYSNFSRSLLESERPDDLKPEDLEEFKNKLDEAAFPFEEKAIKVHEKNMELLHAGVFNSWTEKSLSRLTELMPGRYAKHETSSGFLGAIDTHVEGSPVPQASKQLDSGQRNHPGVGVTDEMRTKFESAAGMLKEERYEPGIALLLTMAEKMPPLTAPHINLGMAYARTGDLDRAEASLNKALQSDPNSLSPITNSVWCSGARDSLQKRARVMRRPSHSPPTSPMRTGILRFCATCISEITPARWRITRRTAGSFRMTPKSSNGLPTFAIAQKNRRGDEQN